MLFIIYVFSLTKSENKSGEQFLPGGGQVVVAQIMYKHVSKCKNDKIKFKKMYKRYDQIVRYE
jgi:hypothetical protein